MPTLAPCNIWAGPWGSWPVPIVRASAQRTGSVGPRQPVDVDICFLSFSRHPSLLALTLVRGAHTAAVGLLGAQGLVSKCLESTVYFSGSGTRVMLASAMSGLRQFSGKSCVSRAQSWWHRHSAASPARALEHRPCGPGGYPEQQSLGQTQLLPGRGCE